MRFRFRPRGGCRWCRVSASVSNFMERACLALTGSHNAAEMKEQFTFNKRVLSEILAKYPDTFVAFCELLNNSIQAEADKIEIQIDYTPTDQVAVSALKKIVLRDNGVGVAKGQFRWKILEVGTKAKQGGKGIGRFAALQMAGRIRIETVAYDEPEKKFFKTVLVLDTNTWKSDSLDKVSLAVTHDLLPGKPDTYYQVTIDDFYGEEVVREEKHRRIHKNFQEDRLGEAIFAAYPEQIFQRKVSFVLNGKAMNPSDYVMGKVEERHETFTSLDGIEHSLDYQFVQLKTMGTHRLFLRVANNNLQTVAYKFDYSVEVPEPNQWFILVDSPFFDQNADIFRNLVAYPIEPNAEHLVTEMQKHVDAFFAKKYEEYRKFTERLRADSSYPYKKREASSESRLAVFNQLAFFLEEKYRLLSDNQVIRELVYALMDRALDSREFEFLLAETIKLDDAALNRFKSVLDKADLLDIITFSEEVAKKQQVLDFLQKLLYSEVAKHVKERSELHKIVERQLWVFGEQYNGVPKLFSDKNLANNLVELRNSLFGYEVTEEDENLVALVDDPVKNITDLFFFNETVINNDEREIMIVELKAPKVRIGDKELTQAKKYAFQIEKQGVFPKNVVYKILLIGAHVSDSAKASCGLIDPKKPFLFHIGKEVKLEVWVIHWSDLLSLNKRKLSYLGNVLHTKDKGAKEMIETEFKDVNLTRLKSKLEPDGAKLPTGRKNKSKKSV
jgi:hypothetical protein